jgi:ureidoacrylate peracid hydrolase
MTRTGAAALEGVDALLVIDMQNSFLKPGGGLYAAHGDPMIDIPRTTEQVGQAVQLATAGATPVIYTRHCYRPGWVDAGERTLRLFDRLGHKPLLAGTWDADVVDELAPPADALIIDKARMDAFIGTALETLLRGLGARRIALTGVVTNACVESTARAASMRDIDVTILEDCCTTFSAEHQRSALAALEFYGFADIASIGERVSA